MTYKWAGNVIPEYHPYSKFVAWSVCKDASNLIFPPPPPPPPEEKKEVVD